eukprot:2675846-Ditylum_brightwellii.AAC.2
MLKRCEERAVLAVWEGCLGGGEQTYASWYCRSKAAESAKEALPAPLGTFMLSQPRTCLTVVHAASPASRFFVLIKSFLLMSALLLGWKMKWMQCM